MKTRRQWMLDALTASGMALEMEQRPGVLAALSKAIQELELALARDLSIPPPLSEEERRRAIVNAVFTPLAR